MSPSWGGVAQGRDLTSVSSIPLHLPPGSVHTQEKARHLSTRQCSLHPSTFLLFSPPAQPQNPVFSLSPLHYLLTSQGQISRKARDLKGNQSSSSQLGGGSQTHPRGLKGRGSNQSYKTLPLRRAGRAERGSRGCSPGVFSPFHFTTAPLPRQAQGGDLVANILREHPGQGAEPFRGSWGEGTE